MGIKAKRAVKPTEDGARYGALFLRDEDRRIEWTDPVTGLVFEIKAKWPKEQRLIGGHMSKLAGQLEREVPGFSFRNMPALDIERLERDATIEVCVIEGPDGWRTTTDAEGGRAPDDLLLDRIAQAISDHTAKLHEELKKNTPAESNGGSGVES